MRFLVDESTGPSVARWLRSLDHDVRATPELRGAILEFAKKELTARHVQHSVLLERGREVATALQTVIEETGAVRVLAAISPHESELEDQLKSLRSILTKTTLPIFVVRPRILSK